MAQSLPKWWPKSGQADQFDDLTTEKLVEIDPHDLLDAELEAYLQAVRRAFGGAAFNLMLRGGLPDQCEEWLEENYPNGDRLYSFLQCLDDWPFESSSEENDSSDENDEEPKGPPPPPSGT